MVYDVLKDALVNQLGIDPSLINPEIFIEKDLQLDSTETVIMALEIKKRYGVNFKFPETDISLSNICHIVDELIKTKS